MLPPINILGVNFSFLIENRFSLTKKYKIPVIFHIVNNENLFSITIQMNLLFVHSKKINTFLLRRSRRSCPKRSGFIPMLRFGVQVLSLFLTIFFVHVTAIAEEVNRVISFAPSVTETIFYLGAESKLVGVSTYCTYPEAAKKIERCNNITQANKEALLKLKPDLIIATDMTSPFAFQIITKLGLKYIVVSTSGDWERILKNNEIIGNAVGLKEEAIKLNQSMQERLDKVLSKIPKDKESPRVLIAYNLKELHCAGENSWMGSILKTLKARNVATSAMSQWPTISREHLLLNKPDIIFSLDDNISGFKTFSAEEYKQLNNDPVFSQLPAVKNKRVYAIEARLLQIPSPTVIQTIEILASLIYPENER